MREQLGEAQDHNNALAQELSQAAMWNTKLHSQIEDDAQEIAALKKELAELQTDWKQLANEENNLHKRLLGQDLERMGGASKARLALEATSAEELPRLNTEEEPAARMNVFELQAKVAVLEEALAETQREQLDAERALAKVAAEKSEAETALGLAQEAAMHDVEERDALQHTIRDIHKDFADLATEGGASGERIARLEVELSRARREANALREQVVELGAQPKQPESLLGAPLGGFEDIAQFASMQTEKEMLEERVQETEAALAEVEHDLGEVTQAKAQISAELIAAEAKLAEAETRGESLGEALENLKQAFADLSDERSGLEDKLAQAQVALQQRELDAENLRAQVRELGGRVQHTKLPVAGAENSLAKYTAAQVENDVLREHLKELEAQVGELSEENTAMSKEKLDMINKNIALDEVLKSTADEAERLRKRVEELEAEAVRQGEEFDRAQNKQIRAQVRAKQSKLDIKALEKQIRELGGQPQQIDRKHEVVPNALLEISHVGVERSARPDPDDSDVFQSLAEVSKQKANLLNERVNLVDQLSKAERERDEAQRQVEALKNELIEASEEADEKDNLITAMQVLCKQRELEVEQMSLRVEELGGSVTTRNSDDDPVKRETEAIMQRLMQRKANAESEPRATVFPSDADRLDDDEDEDDDEVMIAVRDQPIPEQLKHAKTELRRRDQQIVRLVAQVESLGGDVKIEEVMRDDLPSFQLLALQAKVGFLKEWGDMEGNALEEMQDEIALIAMSKAQLLHNNMELQETVNELRARLGLPSLEFGGGELLNDGSFDVSSYDSEEGEHEEETGSLRDEDVRAQIARDLRRKGHRHHRRRRRKEGSSKGASTNYDSAEQGQGSRAPQSEEEELTLRQNVGRALIRRLENDGVVLSPLEKDILMGIDKQGDASTRRSSASHVRHHYHRRKHHSAGGALRDELEALQQKHDQLRRLYNEQVKREGDLEDKILALEVELDKQSNDATDAKRGNDDSSSIDSIPSKDYGLTPVRRRRQRLKV